MTVTLKQQQLKWLQAEVDAGRYPSIDAAAQAIINEHMASEVDIENEDLDWVVPLLDEARAEIARGEFLSLDEFNRFIDEQIAELKR